ncbi:MAG: UvrD-helicase domain-containing protein, partial [candidate division WOR-3 bacterium]|nr:UvrD-helicase domain-containing protein [candidate division WOR-3 bacterium]
MSGLQSKVVFAPAGSGKTEQLSERYIQLLRQNVPPERILTITFTDKAATEMKERILKKAAETDPQLSQLLRDNILKLRISTIHSFCFSLVRRFAHLLDMDPNPQALTDSDSLWQQTKYDTLMKIAEENIDSKEYRLLLDLITTETKQNWNELAELFDRLFKRRTALRRITIPKESEQEIAELAYQLKNHPVGKDQIDNYKILFPDNFTPETIECTWRHLERYKSVFLTSGDEPRRRGFSSEEQKWAQLMARYRRLLLNTLVQDQFEQQFWLFREIFLKAYEKVKQELGQVDYDDMELLALNLISHHDEWQNILYVFDERTDHILVDEFQDTSYLQWEIIDKLTEEWRSGEGAKAAKGVVPTIFIVGDDKQSIYLFRGANVEVFTKAAERLENWLGKERFVRITLENNYRSLPAIIDFNNALFSRLMAPGLKATAWRTRYAPFICQRTKSGPGRVEIILHPAEEELKIQECRNLDARTVARRIRELIDTGYQIYERQSDGSETPRPCCYQDIAILIRSRTQLDAIERALRAYQVPFLVVGGTGFYQEPEIRYLAALTSFLIDPVDDIALYITLRSPLFSIKEKDLLVISNAQYPDKDFLPTLWERISRFATDNAELATAVQILSTALSRVNYQPLHLLLDQILTQTRGWEKFWEPQRAANVRKYLQIIQNMELDGINPYRIKKFLELNDKDEARADVTISGMDVVQIMTVHAAKGLQFPIVFHPGLHEEILSQNSSKEKLIINETVNEQGVVEAQAFYLPDNKIRKGHPVFLTFLEKQIEEEKRVFYVACTRARDGLFLTG